MPQSQINETMTIPEILAQYPQTLTVFQSHGIQPEGYAALQHETLSATSKVHQIDLKALLSALNQIICG